jgi:serine/threonine-protein kinase
MISAGLGITPYPGQSTTVGAVKGTLLRGRYRLVELIDQGGLGDVWIAVDENLARTVAAKLLPAPPPEDPNLLNRLRLDWARFIVRLDHPDVVDVYDLDVGPEGRPFVVMEYVRSESLSALLGREGRMSPAHTMNLVARIADALQAVHAIGVVHRQLGPDRVLVRPDGTVALSVFGLAHLYGLIRPGGVPSVSAVQHAAPEQLTGDSPSTLSDIYSLGVLAYHCLTGRTPFGGDDPLEVARRIVMDEPPPLPTDLPKPSRFIIERAIAKKPGDRWPTAAAFAAAARGVSGARRLG